MLQYSDPAGAASLATVWVTFGGTANNPATYNCALYYNRSTNILYLDNDNATSWLAGGLGTFRVLQNSLCSISMLGTSLSLSGNTLTLRLAVAFTSAYSGSVNIYMSATDVSASTTGWQLRGTWNVQ